MNAVCLNKQGSFDCRRQKGFDGNPFQMCMPIPDLPVIGKDDPCQTVNCGPNAVCNQGTCQCLNGFEGKPADPNIGCQLQGCNNDFSCNDNEICFSFGNGQRRCQDACNIVQCGPNAICVAQKHRSSCLCKDGYEGNPSYPISGCQPVRDVVCKVNGDCPSGQICRTNSRGVAQALTFVQGTNVIRMNFVLFKQEDLYASVQMDTSDIPSVMFVRVSI